MTVLPDGTVSVKDTTSIVENSQQAVLDHRQTPWRSVWIAIGMQFIVGIQISIYYMSMWPYLNGLDKSATLDFLGWVVASCSIGCSIANPIFGWWNEKTMSAANPTIVGFIIAAAGQLMYALLPLFDSNQKWMMIIARTITGFGSGSLSVLRAYVATASVPADKLSAISYGTAGWVLGISFGPAIQAMFTPIGETGFSIGPVVFNMYTVPAYFMVIITLASCFIVKIFFREDYAGVMDANDADVDPNFVIPKYDLWPALICIYLWVVSSMVSTNIEVMSTPMSTAMYDWKDSTSILYNGIIESITCVISVIINLLIGYTRVGKIDKRKQVIFGLFIFLAFHVCNYPWWFYSGPLNYIPNGTTSATHGGCDPSYTWCATSVRIPLPLYIFCFIIFYGIAFPFVGSPSASLYSEILGPRKQGMMQGMYSFGGSVAQFVAPVLATFLFAHSGYKWVMVTQICTLGSATVLMFVFYRRLVPLELVPAGEKRRLAENELIDKEMTSSRKSTMENERF